MHRSADPGEAEHIFVIFLIFVWGLVVLHKNNKSLILMKQQG